MPAIFWLLKTSVFLIIFSLLPQDNTVNDRFSGKIDQGFSARTVVSAKMDIESLKCRHTAQKFVVPIT